jgi:hypothetical protein
MEIIAATRRTPTKLVKNFKPFSELQKEHSDFKDLKKPNRNQNVVQS